MEQTIIYGAVIILVAISAYYFLTKRQKAVYLERVTPKHVAAYLQKGQAVSGRYRGHQVKVELRRNTQARSPESMISRIVVEANAATRGTFTLHSTDHAAFVEEITRLLFPEGLTYKLKGELFITAAGRSIIYDQPGIEINAMYLEFLLRTLTNLIQVYPLAVGLGGEAMVPLQFIHIDPAHPLHTLTLQLQRDIGLDTTARFGSKPSAFYCRLCLARCAAHRLVRPDKTWLKFYGCRVCQQSRDLFEGEVIVTLDSRMTTDLLEQAGLLRINWLNRPQIFDFHAVEIVQATDEEVYQFVEQIDQDPDPVHQHRYGQMRCTIWERCSLATSTVRRLQEVFGPVELRHETRWADTGSRPGKHFSEKLL